MTDQMASKRKFKKFKKHLSEGNATKIKKGMKTKYLNRISDDQDNLPIHIACRNGHLEIVKFFIDHGCNIESESREHYKPIHFACENGHIEIARLLIEHKCDIECTATADNLRPIHMACSSGNFEITKLLVKHHCNVECETESKQWRPIHFASCFGHVEIAKLLLKNHCNIESEDTSNRLRPIHLACSFGHQEIAKLLIERQCNIESSTSSNSEKPIHFACWFGYLEIAKLLIDSHCNIECETASKGWHPIHFATWYGFPDIVKLLIANHCNIECETLHDRFKPIHFAVSSGNMEIVGHLIENQCHIESTTALKNWQPIHFACWYGHYSIVNLLIENNCDVGCETESKKWQPIHFAAYYGHFEIVKLLIENHCNIECETMPYGYTPIHLACQNGHFDIMKLLIENHCDIYSENSEGHTARDMASQHEHNKCVEFFDEIQKYREKKFDCVRRNDKETFDSMCHVNTFFIREENTGISLLMAAVEFESDKIIRSLLDLEVLDSEILYLGNSAEHYTCPIDEAFHLLKECTLYRCIKSNHNEGFNLLCSASIINGPRKIIQSSFLEVAAEYGNVIYTEKILKKCVYDEKIWQQAKTIAKDSNSLDIVDIISRRESFLKAQNQTKMNILHMAICDNEVDMMQYVLDNHLYDPDLSRKEIFETAFAYAYTYERNIDVSPTGSRKASLTSNKNPLWKSSSPPKNGDFPFLNDQLEEIDTFASDLTLLYFAVLRGLPDLCQELVNKGIDFSSKIEICQPFLQNENVSSLLKTTLPLSKRENAVTLCLKIHGIIYPCFLTRIDKSLANMKDGEDSSLLHLAVKCADLKTCNEVISAGALINQNNKDNNTPLQELLCYLDCQMLNNNLENFLPIVNLLLKSGADIERTTKTGMTVFQCASRLSNERLMMALLVKTITLTNITAEDFRMAFIEHWFEYGEMLIELLPKRVLESYVTSEIIHMSMTYVGYRLVRPLFDNAHTTLQISIIEDILHKSVLSDDSALFDYLISKEIFIPKELEDGETLLTNLIISKNTKYCWKLLQSANCKHYINLRNRSQQTPLCMAINAEALDIMEHMIFECNDWNVEDRDGYTPLMQLFKKISSSQDVSIDSRILPSIKSIILRGGEIYKKTSIGVKVINACSNPVVRKNIEDFYNTERKKVALDVVEKVIEIDRKICNICFDNEVDCVFQCGHTFCMLCADELQRCPVCNVEPTNPKRIYLN